MDTEEINYPELSVCLTHVAHGLLSQVDGQWGATLTTKPWAQMSHEERVELVKRTTSWGTARGKVGAKEILEFVYRMAVFEQKDDDGNRIVVIGRKCDLQMVSYTIHRLLHLEGGGSFSVLTLRAHVSALLPKQVEKREEVSRMVTAFILDTALEYLHP